MNIGWFILLNGAIGVAVLMLFCVWCTILVKKSNESEMNRMVEFQDDDTVKSDMIYKSWFGDPRIGRAISLVLFIFAWEFMVPMAVTRAYQHFKRARDRVN